jgi:hypothetical protein
MVAIGFTPEDLADRFGRFSLLGGGLAIQQTAEEEIPLSPWGGLGVVVACAAVSLGLGLWLFCRRDA